MLDNAKPRGVVRNLLAMLLTAIAVGGLLLCINLYMRFLSPPVFATIAICVGAASVALVVASMGAKAISVWRQTVNGVQHPLQPTPENLGGASDILELNAEYSASEGLGQWILRYPAKGDAADVELQLLLGTKQPSSTHPDFFFTSGVLSNRDRGAETGTDFLRALASAVSAGTEWPQRDAANQLDVGVGILGEQLSREVNSDSEWVLAGEFTNKPPGDWLLTKLFLGDEEVEVFLALNPVSKQGLLIRKDPDYGPGIMSEFARLFQ